MPRAVPRTPAQDRRAQQRASARAEDRGLFKRPVVQVPVALSAEVYRNNRGDVIFTGYTGGALSFEVVFAGRRAVMAAPLVSHIASVRDAEERAALRRGAVINYEDVRIPIVLDGAWRTRVWQDRKGWQLRKHQLVVAQWRLGEVGAGTRVFGLAPVQPDE